MSRKCARQRVAFDCFGDRDLLLGFRNTLYVYRVAGGVSLVRVGRRTPFPISCRRVRPGIVEVAIKADEA